MRRIFCITSWLLAVYSSAVCQSFEQPAEGKVLVYFVRYQGAVALADFKYFDGETYLGKGTGNNYFIHECDPGEHVFWVAAENREFIRGDLQANRTYVIEVRPIMRTVSAGVRLFQVSPDDEKALKNIRRLMEKDPAVLKGQEEDQSSSAENAMERYAKIEKKVTALNPDWTF